LNIPSVSHFNGPMTSTPMAHGETVAGRVLLDEVMTRLGRRRPVFHSEADLQHGFARMVWELAGEVETRLEVPQRRGSGKTEYLDLLCLGPGRTAIEFKYFTRRWSGAAGVPAEEYSLRNHAATDLARLHFARDIARLERFGQGLDQNGFAVMVTNEASLWTPPAPGRKPTRDEDFRIHQGRRLEGTLLWAGGAYKRNTLTLSGTYDLVWKPYSELGGAGGEFRYLAVRVGKGG